MAILVTYIAPISVFYIEVLAIHLDFGSVNEPLIAMYSFSIRNIDSGT